MGRLFSGVKVPFFGMGKMYPKLKMSGVSPHWSIMLKMEQRSSKYSSVISFRWETEMPDGPGHVSAGAARSDARSSSIVMLYATHLGFPL